MEHTHRLSATPFNLKNEAVQNFELYIKILSHLNTGEQNGIVSKLVLNEYGLTISDWEFISSYWRIKILNSPNLGLEMIELLEKYNAHFSSILGNQVTNV